MKGEISPGKFNICKLNGATVANILAYMNREFVIWVTASLTLAIPMSWYLVHQWLGNFAYKTTLSWCIFALSGLLALGVALLTVSWQSWKAATRNPVEALRYE